MEPMYEIAFGGLDEDGENIISVEEEERNEQVMYGDLVLSIAPKENKANTLLASSLFSPSFFLAEQIELGLLPVHGKTVLELGAGAALPSLLLSILPKAEAPSLIVATDYPDTMIIGNLKANVERNAQYKHGGTGGSAVDVIVEGYKWGDDPAHVLRHLNRIHSPDYANASNANTRPGFDILILCDLLHFDQSHSEIILSISYLLKKAAGARVYVIAGKYTRRGICESFLGQASRIGLVWDEYKYGDTRRPGDVCNLDTVRTDHCIPRWGGVLPVLVGKTLLTEDDLVQRRDNCWGWVGRWREEKLNEYSS